MLLKLTAVPTALVVLLAIGAGAQPAHAAEPSCYFPSSFFCQRLAPNAPVDPDSAAIVAEVRNMAYGVDPQDRFDCHHAVMTDDQQMWTDQERQFCQKVTYRAGINYDAYAPMLYTVSGDQGRVPVVL